MLLSFHELQVLLTALDHCIDDGYNDPELLALHDRIFNEQVSVGKQQQILQSLFPDGGCLASGTYNAQLGIHRDANTHTIAGSNIPADGPYMRKRSIGIGDLAHIENGLDEGAR
jgi:hypothetical protein